MQNQNYDHQESFQSKNQKSQESSTSLENSLDQFVDSVFQLIMGIQDYQSPFARREPYSPEEAERLCKEITQKAALKTAGISATASLPGGFIGFVTILPELLMIFRIQGMLVKDIASIYGKEAQLTKELLLFSLFKNGSAHLFRKFVEESGVRILIRPATVRAFQAVLQKLGLTISRRILRKNLTRWVPIAGAALTGSFTYFDTLSVGKNAVEIFSKEIQVYPLLESPSETES